MKRNATSGTWVDGEQQAPERTSSGGECLHYIADLHRLGGYGLLQTRSPSPISLHMTGRPHGIHHVPLGGSWLTTRPRKPATDLGCRHDGARRGRVSSARGAVAVEELVEGHGASGRCGPGNLVWFGHRMVNCTRHSEPRRVWPVHVVAHEFAAGQPERELWLSRGHALSRGT
jgi:hypothetical protein